MDVPIVQTTTLEFLSIEQTEDGPKALVYHFGQEFLMSEQELRDQIRRFKKSGISTMPQENALEELMEEKENGSSDEKPA